MWVRALQALIRPRGVSAPGEGQQLWVAEKKDYHGQPIPPNGSPEWKTYPGHYTQMVWRDTKEVGCATGSASGSVSAAAGGYAGQTVYLVCRYSPPGNTGGPPY
jgi:pathogenesis-related protein 1